MFVLASLMALAAAGAALDLTSSGRDEDDDADDLPSALGKADAGEVGAVSSGDPETGFPEIQPGPEPLEPDEAPLEPVADMIQGGAEGDDLFGGGGNDTILAGTGNDWVQGDGNYEAAGDDEIHGGAGDDSLAGQGGDDIVWGDEGDDTIQGGEGQDTLFGGAGNDWLSGHDGDDVLAAGGGGDDLDGGRGNDLLVGDEEPQTVWLHGGEGDDTLMPGAGDFAEGQQGADDFVVKQGDGDLPVIADFDSREDQMILHLPESLAQDAQVDLTEDQDGTMLVTVNGDPVARMLQAGGLTVADIVIVRLPG